MVPIEILTALGLPDTATLPDVLAALEALKAPPAPQATAVPQAPPVATEAATVVAATAVMRQMGEEIVSLRARVDSSERASLMAGRKLTPAVTKFLGSQPVDVVRTYLASVPAGEPAMQPATPVTNGVTRESAEAVSRATGVPVDAIMGGVK